jgi:hypothetical protein
MGWLVRCFLIVRKSGIIAYIRFVAMDAFGFKTQGINYDKFRPKYPTSFL